MQKLSFFVEIYETNEDLPQTDCSKMESQWSPCSKTCGLGVSTKVTNVYSDCVLRQETRLCMLRPCQQTEDHENSEMVSELDVEEFKCEFHALER